MMDANKPAIVYTTPHTGSDIKLMECLYIILEAGCNIRSLSTTHTTHACGERIRLVFEFNKNTWTIESATPSTLESVNNIYACLETLNIVSRSEWHRHKLNFFCCRIANNTGHKNIEIMQFVMNAIKSGWRVRKSFTIRSEYTFHKRHNMKYKYLSGKFLSRFLDNMHRTKDEPTT